MGLAVPQVSRVFLSLAKGGIPISPRVYTVEAAKEEILRCVKERGQGR